jgi:serine protease Do
MLSGVWYTDKKHDLAFLQPPPVAAFPSIPLGKYELMKDGDEVIAIGHPFGLNYTATQGVVRRLTG